MLANHRDAIEVACTDLRSAVFADETVSLIDAYRRFEHAVKLHLEIEEHELLPGFSECSILGAAELRLQHIELRERLYRLGIEVELHRARIEDFDHLFDALLRHLRIEEEILYPWVEVRVDSQRSMFDRIGRSVRDLAKLRERLAA